MLLKSLSALTVAAGMCFASLAGATPRAIRTAPVIRVEKAPCRTAGMRGKREPGVVRRNDHPYINHAKFKPRVVVAKRSAPPKQLRHK